MLKRGEALERKWCFDPVPGGRSCCRLEAATTLKSWESMTTCDGWAMEADAEHTGQEQVR
jgi:hypothetical protein